MGIWIENLLQNQRGPQGGQTLLRSIGNQLVQDVRKKNSQLLALHTSITSSFDTSLVVEKKYLYLLLFHYM